MDSLIQDARYAVRSLLKSPGFTLVALLTLALGIGANAAIFSAVEAVLLKPLPYPGADRMVFLRGEALTTANVLDWRRQASSYEQFAAVSIGAMDFAGPAGPERVGSIEVSADFFPLLGLRPARGRALTAGDYAPGQGGVAVVTDRFWREQLGAATDAVGLPLTLDRRAYILVGVMPLDVGPLPYQDADVWVPLDPAARAKGTGVVARLKPGVDLRGARAEAEMIARRSPAAPSARTGASPVVIESLKDRIVGASRLTLLLLTGAVAFVLLIGCLNVANLLLARSATRSREIAVRTALGASRARVVRQLFTEALLLAAAGAALGLVLAQWALRLLLVLLPYPIPRIGASGIDGTVLAFTVALALAAAVGFGLAPALGASRADLGVALKEGSRQVAAGRRQRRLRESLVAAEVALALVLLVGAGLLIRTFLALHPAHPGFDARNKLVVRAVMPGVRDSQSSAAPRMLDALVDRVGAVPGARAVAATTDLPFTGDAWVPDVWIEGKHVAGRDLETVVLGRATTPNYFRTMGMAMARGRDFQPSDDAGAPRVAIVNETLARRFWPGASPDGRRFEVRDGAARVEVTVVGVVRDERVSGEEAGSEPELYVPFRQIPSARLDLVIQAEREPLDLAAPVRRALAEVAPGLIIGQVTTLDRILADSVAFPRFHAILLGILAAVALSLALVGLYGVVSYTTSLRLREMGIRMALGAARADILRLVVGEAVRMVLVGVTVGVVAALALTGVLAKLLVGVTAGDPATFAAVGVAMLAVALVACYVPARAATRVDPVMVMRSE